MARFRDIKTLQKFSAVHASIYNYAYEGRRSQAEKLVGFTAWRTRFLGWSD